MRFWLARDSDVSIREQLVTQVVLGILSSDLAAGQRLPSVRELARRFHLHANTVSAAYRQLEQEGWVESRRGSGVYVAAAKRQAVTPPALVLDQRIASLFQWARENGVPQATVRARLNYWLTAQPPDHFLVIEPNDDLREIVIYEARQAVTMPVLGCNYEACHLPQTLAGAIPLVLPSKAETVREILPAASELLVLQVRSIPSSLQACLPAQPDLLVAIASRWPEFIKSARTMLIAAGFHPDSLISRDARAAGWKRGLKQASAVVCDSVSARQVPAGCQLIVFPLLAESAVAELKSHQQFVESPIVDPL